MKNRVLLTGMTAPQSSQRRGKRSASFASIIYDELTRSGSDVTWADAQGSWTIDDMAAYDAVLLGVAPVLSLSANKAYSVLSLIDTLKNDSRLTLFIDAPEPEKVYASLKSASKNYDVRLFKSFYAKRKDFSTSSIVSKIVNAVEFLLNDTWPSVLYPMLPWDTACPVSTNLPQNVATAMTGVQIDACYLTGGAQLATSSQRANHWAAASIDSSWTVETSKNLMYPSIPMTRGRSDSDAAAVAAIASSIGSLIGPHSNKQMWWSPRFRQSLYTLTPVVTDWRTASDIGSAWSHLAAGVEEMSHIDRYELAVAQREQYDNALLSKDNVITQLHKEIGLTAHVNTI